MYFEELKEKNKIFSEEKGGKESSFPNGCFRGQKGNGLNKLFM